MNFLLTENQIKEIIKNHVLEYLTNENIILEKGAGRGTGGAFINKKRVPDGEVHYDEGEDADVRKIREALRQEGVNLGKLSREMAGKGGPWQGRNLDGCRSQLSKISRGECGVTPEEIIYISRALRNLKNNLTI